jgi:hypothetical protein
MIKSPSKHIPLKKLKEIKENSYRTACGLYEYCSDEIDDLIQQKENKKMLDDYNKIMKQIEQQFSKKAV